MSLTLLGRSGYRLRNPRQLGATLIEFALALTFGVLPLVLGILQIAALLVAKNELNLATFLAAREGAVAGADPGAMQRMLARSLVPLYVRAGRGGVAAPGDVALAYADALAEVISLDSLLVLNPTRGELDRLGTTRGGQRVIPNDSIEFRPRAVQDANVLNIEVTHCQKLVVPLAGPALATALRALDGDPRHQRCLAAGRAPIVARASIVMQSDVRATALR
jgi:TadE-like protein